MTTIIHLENKIEEVISGLDELNWVPGERLAGVRNRLSGVLGVLRGVEQECGNEPSWAECGGDSYDG